MAYAVMGGLATLLTPVFLPALCVTRFRIEPQASPRRPAETVGAAALAVPSRS
jgi:hypothetical protein